jgi:hypothetical protein
MEGLPAANAGERAGCRGRSANVRPRPLGSPDKPDYMASSGQARDGSGEGSTVGFGPRSQGGAVLLGSVTAGSVTAGSECHSADHHGQVLPA